MDTIRVVALAGVLLAPALAAADLLGSVRHPVTAEGGCCGGGGASATLPALALVLLLPRRRHGDRPDTRQISTTSWPPRT